MINTLKLNLRRWLLAVFTLLFAQVLFVSGVRAIARGYATSDSGLQNGMVVALSLESGSAPSVERATQASSERVVGVVTTTDASLVSIGSNSSQVLVESEGQVDSYVSDINGKVQKGDALVLSPLKGILMKNLPGTTTPVIAIAADNVTLTEPYSYEADTKTQTTAIAKIKVNLNQVGTKNNSNGISNSSLARIGRSIVGKDVGEARVLIALVIFIIVLIAEGSILYGAITSAVTALGRNPLARKVIRAELIRVIVVAILVLAVGLGAVYGILWI